MNQPESPSLDFKREPWNLTNDDGKSKFIKDVVCMANADRHETAHILVGVDAPAGRRKSIVPVTHRLDDADLQAIVKDKVDPLPVFLYEHLKVKGQLVAVLSVPPKESRISREGE